MKITPAFLLILFIYIFAAGTPALAGEHCPQADPDSAGRPGEEKEITLAEELSGLPPEARIAYLNHLIRGGRNDSEVFFQLAVTYHGISKADSAISYYKKAIEKDGKNFKAYVNLGVLFDDQALSREAEKNFRLAVAINPDDVLANSHLALMIFQRKKYDEAWKYLSHALKMGPDNPQPRFYLAIFFWESRMYREAMAEWEKVVELDKGGYLAERARENIVMLQNVLNSTSDSGEWKPER